MMRPFIFSFVSFLAVNDVMAQTPHFFRGRPVLGLVPPPSANSNVYAFSEDAYMIYGNISQPVDHFNSTDNRQWKQQYQYNTKFYKNSTGLVFLQIGGENPIGGYDELWIRNENVSMVSWAREFGAAIFQVEHRFFGNSRPFPQQTTEALAYCTIEQVMDDLKEFITQMNELYFPNDNPKWITFGGSYAGSLSAWFREAYPEMTIAAVSSSSAVNVKVNYYGYATNAEANYRGVDAHCGEQIEIGMKQMMNDAFRDEESRSELVKTYNLCQNFTGENYAKEVQFFFSNILGMFYDFSQYSGNNVEPRRDGLNLTSACSRTSGNDASTAILRIYQLYTEKTKNHNCMINNYTSFIEQLKDPGYKEIHMAAYRTWMWQTCTYLGYYTTNDGGHSMWQSIQPLDFFVDQCIDIFGSQFNADYTYAAVARTQMNYGGDRQYRGTKVVFPNGSLDPYVSLGKLTPNEKNDVDAFIIEGCAHHSDMYPPGDGDLQSLIDARKRIHDHLARWIKESEEANDSPSSQF